MKKDGPFELDTDTEVEAIGEGAFFANITDRWSTYNGPDGGYVMMIAAKALGEIMPHPDPLTSTAHFLRPPIVGSATVETRLIRAGRRMATGSATLIQQDRPVVSLLSTFTDLDSADGRTHSSVEAPKLPLPEDCFDPMDFFPTGARMSIGDRVKPRVPVVPGWLKGEPTGNTDQSYWFSFADGRGHDPYSMFFAADGAPPIIFELGEIGSITLELTVQTRAKPTTQWLICRKSTRFLVSGYFEEDLDMFDEQGKLVAQSRQLAMIP